MVHQYSAGTQLAPKCAKEISPKQSHHEEQPEQLIKGRMDPCFYVVYTSFSPYHVNAATEIETQIHNNSLIVQFWCVHGNFSISFMFLADRLSSSA